MLFDLRGRGRQNTVKVVYITLAFLMGGGLVLFGIGGNTNGGLVDAITGSGSSGDVGADRYKKDIADARKRLAANRQDESAWSDLIGAQVQLAQTGDKYNSATNAYTSAGKADLRDAIASWTAFQKIGPKDEEEEGRVAKKVVNAYLALNEIGPAIDAQEIAADSRDATGPYSDLAELAYAAGQTRRGDLAAEKAVSLETPDQRAQLKARLKEAKQQGAAAAASATPAPSPTVTATPKKGK